MENDKDEGLSLKDILNQLEQELSDAHFNKWFRGHIASWLSEVTARKSELYPGNKKGFAGNAKLFPLKSTDHWSIPQQCAMLGAWHEVQFKGPPIFSMPEKPKANTDGIIPLLSVLQGMAWEGLLRGVREGEPETWEVELRAMLRNVKAAWKAASRPRGGAGKKRGRPKADHKTVQQGTKLASKKQCGNQGMSHTEANEIAMKLAKEDSEFVNKPQREWARSIGCSEGTVAKTTMWLETMKETDRGRKGKSLKPKIVTWTPGLEATVGQGEKHEVLNQLIAEQKADMEPSPLDQEGRNPKNYRD